MVMRAWQLTQLNKRKDTSIGGFVPMKHRHFHANLR